MLAFFSLFILGVIIEQACPFFFLSTEFFRGEFLNKKLEDFTFFVEFGLNDICQVVFGVCLWNFADSMLSLGTFFVKFNFLSAKIVSKSTEYLKLQEFFKCLNNKLCCSESVL